jgi:signal transduction histidine kinase
VTVLADPTQIAQLVMNLCINAGHAMDEQGTVRVSLDSAVRIEGTPTEHPDELCLTVADTGSGIAPEVLERMFDPFFTTKAPGKGSGLGLSVVYGIVTALGGRIDVQSRADGADRGSSVRVFLPIVPAWSRTGGLRVAHTAR